MAVPEADTRPFSARFMWAGAVTPFVFAGTLVVCGTLFGDYSHLSRQIKQAMATPRIALSLLILLNVSLSGQVHLPAAWEAADRQTTRLPPSEFRDLSKSIRDELLHRGCTIPQATHFRPGPHNVIKGAFKAPEQEDIAVLCSRDRISSILVFRGGSADSVDELARKPDAAFLQTVDARGTIAFSRTIDVAGVDYIRKHHDAYGGPKPPRLDHAGIEDGFMGKASAVWYLYRGNWLRLTGAD